jgi:hypothetical protein
VNIQYVLVRFTDAGDIEVRLCGPSWDDCLNVAREWNCGGGDDARRWKYRMFREEKGGKTVPMSYDALLKCLEDAPPEKEAPHA